MNIGNSPIISYRVKYKITYGDWTEQMVSLSQIFRIIILYLNRNISVGKF